MKRAARSDDGGLGGGGPPALFPPGGAHPGARARAIPRLDQVSFSLLLYGAAAAALHGRFPPRADLLCYKNKPQFTHMTFNICVEVSTDKGVAKFTPARAAIKEREN
jgi:hypothetical protein